MTLRTGIRDWTYESGLIRNFWLLALLLHHGSVKKCNNSKVVMFVIQLDSCNLSSLMENWMYSHPKLH